eukprot:m.259657 g.259657  ORF g.259657 m.259657 type:complete len:323 (+) comp22734_c0_seq4:1-969(+)
MTVAMQEGIFNMESAVSFALVQEQHLDLLSTIAHKNIGAFPTPAPAAQEKVAIGITSYNRPELLLKTVHTIIKQTYPRELMHLIVADDASTNPLMNSTLAEIRQLLDDSGISYDIQVPPAHTYVAATRNRILNLAQQRNADFVCFMDDDDLAEEFMVSVYMRVAMATGADIVTDFSDNYDVTDDGRVRFSHRSVAVGNAFAHNFFLNNYGKANFCVRPGKALAIGGHHSGAQSNSPYVDWGFLTRASLHNLKIELVPMALYKYTKNSQGSIWSGRTSPRDRYDGHGKMLRDMEKFVPYKFWDVLRYCRYQLAMPKVAGDGLV